MTFNEGILSGDHTPDPYMWLEEVDGHAALTWVREQNDTVNSTIAATHSFKNTNSDILEVLDSDDKIAMVSAAGDYLYNFWRDAQHPRGIWRRTTREEYAQDKPAWDVLLDVDALCETEDINWVFHGASLLRPTFDRALIALSKGGTDADETREFDLATRSFVSPQDGGFYRPESKGGMTWININEVFVYTDFGPDEDGQPTLTSSGYPRVVKKLQRGQTMRDAQTVYAGVHEDMYISAWHSFTPGYERNFVGRSLAFYNSETYLLHDDGALTLIDVPRSAEVSVRAEWIMVELRDDWIINGVTYVSGSLLVTRFEDFLAGKREFTVLFAPTPSTSLAGAAWTKNYLVLNVMEDVKNRVSVVVPPLHNPLFSDDATQAWTHVPFTGLPQLGTVSVSAVDSLSNDDVWVVSTDYLTPTALSRIALEKVITAHEIGEDAQLVPLKSMPEFFDAEGLTVQQHFATSRDGTRIPYFIVHRTDIPLDGTTPTLLYGYGGFEISLTPSYSGALGRGWLTRGGAYVVANIRGGGEYGPRWHQAALKENRHKAYEDFSAVARDLIDRKITSTPHLGADGRSNGGLLTGNMLTQYPDLFGAVVIGVPLLDMKRYTHLLAGASWMAEYGDPDDPEQWKYIQTFSPYHLFDPQQDYPPVLLLTSTRDDRVHPGHARKLAAKLLEANKNVTYYENIEGGHGGAADNKQSAFMATLTYEFLWEKLA
ncbi:prolyl oligopeptidase family serine peptidase [Timonella sp. A28]|uniref:prolyl oligopeptidase family serine peptidase n=1 Tax=Timonella sp. A28 TaxID=3442640 RepID=UPI003EBE2F6F